MLSRLRSAWRQWRQRTAFERLMADEMRFHLESRAADLERRGHDPAAARRQARLEFGNPAVWQERCRESRGFRLVEDFAADVRFALRGFRRHKLVSLVVVVTLAFGIGVSAGVFAMFDAIALRARINADPASFVRVFTASSLDRLRPGPPAAATVEEYTAFVEQTRTLRSVSAYFRSTASFGSRDQTRPRVLLVSCNFFETYSVPTVLVGRLLDERDCRSSEAVGVISEDWWRSRFAADPTIVDTVVTVNGTPVTVVGIAARSTAEVDNAVAWFPYTMRGALRLGAAPAEDRWLSIGGRLASGATRATALAELNVIAARLDRLHPGRSTTVAVTDGAMISDPGSSAPVVSIMTLVMGGLTCLVLIACGNVTTLLLSRADARQREVAVRLSLGAGRGRVVRMLLTEVLVLAAAAGLTALYVAYEVPLLLNRWLVGRVPPYSLAPDWRVFLYLSAVTGFAALAAGLAPALESARTNVLDSLRGRRSLFGTGGVTGLRAWLIGMEIALSFVLLVGAALFAITHYRIVTGEPGFDSRSVFMPQLTPRDGGSTVVEPISLREALAGVPGVQQTAFARTLPFRPQPQRTVSSAAGVTRTVDTNEVTSGYFATLGLPILRGRPFNDEDAPCARWCHIIVSVALARLLAPEGGAVGQVLHDGTGASLEIVGVAADTSVRQIGQPDPPLLYTAGKPQTGAQLVVRFGGDGAAFSAAAGARLRERFPEQLIEARTARSFVDEWFDEIGRVELLIVALGAAAAALAVMGVFGVVSFSARRRTHEIGVRIALGASRRQVYTAVMSRGVRPVAIGLSCGIVASLLTATAFRQLLGRLHLAVNPMDPVIYVAVTTLLTAVIGAALFVPARRAAATAPLVALRYE